MVPPYCDCPTEFCYCPTTIHNATQEYPYRPYVHTHEYSPATWEPKYSKRCLYPITNEYHVPRSRSTHSHNGVTQSSFCPFCHYEYCQCPHSKSKHPDDMHTRCSYCGYESCRCHPTKLGSRQEALKPAKRTNQMLLIQLFEAKKKEKKYDEAREFFHEAVAYDRGRPISDGILKLKASFADMQATQQKYEEAEDIINDILKCKGLPSALERQCNAIKGKILCSRKRFKEAEDLYRKLYDRTSKDEWSLDMGDQMCEVIASQGDYDLAQLEQAKLWEKRTKTLGKDHPSTVRSAIMAVDHLKKMIQKVPAGGGSHGDRAQKRKQALEADIEYILSDIWTSIVDGPQKQETSMLKAGHELGTSLCNQQKYAEAEKILAEVWRGRNFKLGEIDKDTMSSGISLSEAMYCQGGLEKCRAAARILETIEALGTAQTYGDSIVVAAGAHLAVAYSRLGEQAKAENLCRRSMNIAMDRGGVSIPPPERVRYALGRALIGQSGNKKTEGQKLLAEVNYSWQPHQSTAQDTLIGCKLLTGTLSPLAGTISEHIESAQEAFRASKDLLAKTGRKDSFYSAGWYYGMLLLQSRNLERAKIVLREIWNQKTEIAEENRVRARCGDLYGQCLTKGGQFTKAKQVLEAVRTLKKVLYPGPANKERQDTGNLIRALAEPGRGSKSLTTKTSKRSEPPNLLSLMIS